MRSWTALFAASALIGPAVSAQKNPPVPVIKTTAQTVLVDVVVADRNLKPLAGLHKEDFTVLDDGKQQAISYFEVHGGKAVHLAPPPKLPPGMYSNFSAPIQGEALNVVLLDSLNTPAKDQMMVRKQMIDYLKGIPAGTRIAIFTLASHLRMVNGFTTDPQVLLDTLNRKGQIEGVDISPILITPAEQQNEEKRQDQLLATGNINNPDASPEQKQAILQGINSMRQFVSDQTSFNDDVRVKMTLAAMDQLGRYLSPFPGRKNVIWFSASFPIGVDPDFNQVDAYRMMRDYSIDIRKTAQRLALARVAVYPIDARRFFQTPQFDPSNGGASMSRNAYYRADAIDLASDTVTKEHDTMDQIAEETGGRAIYNTNDLKGAMGEVISSGDVYYTLAYDPVNQKLDGRYHKIVVKFSQPSYKVLYRHGYVAEDAKAKAKKPEQPNKERTGQANSLFRAEMEPGGPPVSEILFRLEPIVEPNQPAAGDPAKGDNPKVTKPVVRYVFDYAADVGGMQMAQTDDGIRHGLLLTMIIAYDKQGRPLNSALNTQTLDLDPKVYSDSMKTGLPFYQELDIPPGEVTVRAGVYDVISGKMGAFEFPLTVQSQR